jgi:uroporphyrinogen-III decarboxylase
LFDPFAGFQYNLGNGSRGARQIASLFSTPEYRAMIRDFWAIDDFYKEYQAKADLINEEVRELGYPVVRGGGVGVPFDFYSDFLRGTLLSMADLYDRPEDVQRYIDEALEVTLEAIKATKGKDEGKHVFMALHKGMDGFMSDEHYRRYYWGHLQKIILAIIDSGKVPYIYTEGKYNSRIDCLTEVPPGKVFYHFEDVDMAAAKKKLGGIACISGGFPAALLDWGTPLQVREEMKRLFDACAPGGGFIFETSCGLGNCKRENVEAMFEEAKKLGVY